MSDFSAALQIAIALLSVPLVTAALGWVARRFTKEGRLTIRLERLASIYPNLPDGVTRKEFGARIDELTAELNARLDPLFKKERRRKRKVVVALAFAAGIASLLISAINDRGSADSATTWIGLVLGAIAVGAFFLIELDTKRQRAAIAIAREELGD